MGKFKSYNIDRDINVKIDLNSMIDEDHLCKHIERIVSTLDTSSIESNYSSIGRNALHPKMMLSIIFYGYTQGIRSGRKLSLACKENLCYIYLSKGYYPKKTALNEFRRKNYCHFLDLFTQVVQITQQTDIGDFSFCIADGSKMDASSSKHRTKNIKQFSKWQETLLGDIAEIEQELSDEKIDLESKEKVKKNLPQ